MSNSKINVTISISKKTLEETKRLKENDGFCLSRFVDAQLKKEFDKKKNDGKKT